MFSKKTKMRFIEWKQWFDIGFNLTQFGKNVAMILVGVYLLSKDAGISLELAVTLGVIGGLGYIILCFMIGLFWDKGQMIHLQNEFSNRRNPTLSRIEKKVSK